MPVADKFIASGKVKVAIGERSTLTIYALDSNNDPVNYFKPGTTVLNNRFVVTVPAISSNPPFTVIFRAIAGTITSAQPSLTLYLKVMVSTAAPDFGLVTNSFARSDLRITDTGAISISLGNDVIQIIGINYDDSDELKANVVVIPVISTPIP